MPRPGVATLFNPLGAGIRWGVTVPGTSAGDVVAVLGPGVRGLSACAAAKDAGAAFVMVTGVGPQDDERLALAKAFGADLAVDVSATDPAKALRKATGQLADVVVDVTAKAPAALGQAVAAARVGGTVVLAGTRGSADTPGFWPDLIVYKELRILGVLGVDAPAYRAALDLLATGRYPFVDLPRRRRSPLGGSRSPRAIHGRRRQPGPPVHGVITPNERGLTRCSARGLRPAEGGGPLPSKAPRKGPSPTVPSSVEPNRVASRQSPPGFGALDARRRQGQL